jgi:hypothetical protein
MCGQLHASASLPLVRIGLEAGVDVQKRKVLPLEGLTVLPQQAALPTELYALLLPTLYCCTLHGITNSMALVRERTIPAERPPLVVEVSANFWG